MEEIKTKVCKRCGKEAPITEFSKNKQSKDGHHIYCRTCRNELALKYYYNKKARLANNTSGGGTSSDCIRANDRKGCNPKFDGVTSRELINELKDRGYKWSSMWVERVEVKKQFVKI